MRNHATGQAEKAPLSPLPSLSWTRRPHGNKGEDAMRFQLVCACLQLFLPAAAGLTSVRGRSAARCLGAQSLTLR